MQRALIAVVVAAAVSGSPLAAQTIFGINPVMDTDTRFVRIEVSPFSSTDLGGLGLPALSGLDFQPASALLYASGGNTTAGNLYRIDIATPSVTLVGATGFASVPGLAFDNDGLTLFGSAQVTGATLNSDGLIVIDPFTGAGTLRGLYGMQNGNIVRGLDAIAIHPITGVLYAVAGSAFDGTQGDVFTIDKTTGAATRIGALTSAMSGMLPPATVAGLSFASDTQLFGSLGGGDGRIINIDLSTLTFNIVGDAAMGSVSDIAIYHRPAADIGFGKVGGNGLIPDFHAIGSLVSGGTALMEVVDAPPGTLAFLLLSVNFNPFPIFGGTAVSSSPFFVGPFLTDPFGRIGLNAPGGFGPFTIFGQWAFFDPGAQGGSGLSNILVINFLP